MVFTFLDSLKNAGCLVRKQFHLYCPGCGGTRAVEALLRLHPLQSLAYNPVVVLMLLMVACHLAIRLLEWRRNGQKLYRARITVNFSFLGLWFLYFVVRNILLLWCGIDLLGDFS
jgi:hypothetical protein